MDLKYDDLATFLSIHQAGTFTAASKELGVSQSALSQKMARLEDVLQATIFIRHPRSLSLTATGERLLVYAREAVERQREFLENYDQYQSSLSGVLRIAGYSSIMNSLVIPQLAPLIREYPQINLEFSAYEMYELEEVLKMNRADLILTDYFPHLPQVEENQIGDEEYVVITPKKYKKVPHTFLDHTPMDNATESFFQFQGLAIDYKRAFMGDVHSIIEGVALGIGKAVMSKHLIEKDKRFVIKKHKKNYSRPIVLSYFKQSYYSPLHLKVIERLKF